MLGWNSVGVFDAPEYDDGETLHVNRGCVFVVLMDPYPEFREFVFLDGEFHHVDDLLSMEYEGVLEDHFESYGEAAVVPLGAVAFIERDDDGIPRFVESALPDDGPAGDAPAGGDEPEGQGSADVDASDPRGESA